MPLSLRADRVPFGRRGRRLSDPPDQPPGTDALAVRGRLAGVSVRASIAAGAWVGFALGLAIGTGLGALFVWFAGNVLDWQRDLAFTFGVTQRLLPFGDQIGLLRSIRSTWYLVIPAVGVVMGLSAAIVGGLIGGLIAVTYNRSPRHALVIVELPRDVAATEASLAAGAGGEIGVDDAADVSTARRPAAELPAGTAAADAPGVGSPAAGAPATGSPAVGAPVAGSASHRRRKTQRRGEPTGA